MKTYEVIKNTGAVMKTKTVVAIIACVAIVSGYSAVASGQQVFNPAVSYPTAPANGGPGTEMTRIINRIGLGSDCGRCKALAAEMDRGGADWVQNNKSYVVQRTISNAKALGHRMGPVQRMGVKAIVQRSVRRSR